MHTNNVQHFTTGTKNLRIQQRLSKLGQMSASIIVLANNIFTYFQLNATIKDQILFATIIYFIVVDAATAQRLEGTPTFRFALAKKDTFIIATKLAILKDLFSETL